MGWRDGRGSRAADREVVSLVIAKEKIEGIPENAVEFDGTKYTSVFFLACVHLSLASFFLSIDSATTTISLVEMMQSLPTIQFCPHIPNNMKNKQIKIYV